MSRAQALKPHEEDAIWALWLRKVPRAQIACNIGTSPTTVSAVVKRIRRALNEQRMGELEELRTQALAEYDAIQHEAWTRVGACPPGTNVAVGYLSVVLDARRQQDRLLGLEQLTVNHRAVQLTRIEAILSSPVPIALPGPDDNSG